MMNNQKGKIGLNKGNNQVLYTIKMKNYFKIKIYQKIINKSKY